MDSLNHYTWKYWIDDVDNIPNLSDSEIKLAKEAIRVIMKKVFKASINSPSHSLGLVSTCLHTNTFRTRCWFIWLAQSIENVIKQTNGRQLVDKLKKKEMFRSLLLDLSVANNFINRGFDVEFYPKVNGTNKKHDLKVISRKTKEQFYVEISEL